MYDQWGQVTQNGHKPHSSTAPQDSAITTQPTAKPIKNGTRKPPIDYKHWINSSLFAGGVLGSLWLISAISSLGSRSTNTIPQAIELEPTAPTEEMAPDAPPPLDDLASRRSQAWESVNQACEVDLPAITAEVDSELTSARADSWLLYAKQQCDADKNCQSPYDWLRQQLDNRGGKIQAITLADRLPTKSQPAADFRQNLADLTDISKALSSGVSARSLSWVPADRLNDAIDNCSDAAKRYESLTRAAEREATAIPGGVGNGF